jgi:hypothetical protein
MSKKFKEGYHIARLAFDTNEEYWAKKSGETTRQRIFIFKVDKNGVPNISISGGRTDSTIGPFNSLQEVKNGAKSLVEKYGYIVIVPAWGSDKDMKKDIAAAHRELGVLKRHRMI